MRAAPLFSSGYETDSDENFDVIALMAMVGNAALWVPLRQLEEAALPVAKNGSDSAAKSREEAPQEGWRTAHEKAATELVVAPPRAWGADFGDATSRA